MRNKALVIQNNEGKSEVLVYRNEACGNCDSCGSCDAKPMQMWIENTLQAQPGQMVTLEMEGKAFFSSMMQVYILPLVLFVAGIFLMDWYLKTFHQPNELLSLAGGVMGLLIFALISRFLNRRAEKSSLVKMVQVQNLEEVFAAEKE